MKGKGLSLEIGETQPLLGSTKETKDNKSGNLGIPEWLNASIIMSNIIVGIGLLNFSQAYSEAGGLLIALPIQVVFVVLVALGMFLMVYSSHQCGRETYHETVHYYCGRPGLIVCNVLIIIHNFGACITFLVILADQLDSVILFSYGPDFCGKWFLSRTFTVPICSLLFILPFCFPEKINSFRFGSILGVITVSYVLCLSIYEYTISDAKGKIPDNRLEDWTDIFKVIPTVCFSFEAHVESVPLYACFKKRMPREFAKAIIGCMLIALVLYTITGSFGYLTFGSDVPSDLLTAYKLDVPVIIAAALMGLKVVTTYPVVFFCVRLVADDLMTSVYHFGPDSFWSEKKRRIVFTTIMYIIAVAVAVTVPTIGSLIALLGGTASFFIFIFPGLCFMLTSYNSGEKAYSFLGASMVVLGTFLFTCTTIQSGMRYYRGEFSQMEVACDI